MTFFKQILNRNIWFILIVFLYAENIFAQSFHTPFQPIPNVPTSISISYPTTNSVKVNFVYPTKYVNGTSIPTNLYFYCNVFRSTFVVPDPYYKYCNGGYQHINNGITNPPSFCEEKTAIYPTKTVTFTKLSRGNHYFVLRTSCLGGDKGYFSDPIMAKIGP